MTTPSIYIPETPVEEKFQTRQVLTIVGGHFIHDTYSAFVAPLLPLIIEKLSLSLTLAGSLIAVMQFPAVLNPFIGYLADRISVRYFVILAPAVTGTLISLLGFAPSYMSLIILLLATGVSVASFHAPAPAMVGRISGKQLGKGMSFFMAGGELGRTVGPILAVWLVSVWSLDGFYRIMVLGWATSLILYWQLHHIPARTKPRPLQLFSPRVRRVFLPLTGIIFPRTFMLTAVAIYLPTFLTQQGKNLWLAGIALSAYELAGVAGALTGGILSDRVNRKVVVGFGTIGSALLLLIFLNVKGWLIFPVLLAMGFTALSVSPVILAIVQEQMPNNRAAANGIFMFLSFVVRTFAIFANGLWGDHFGLVSAYQVGAFVAMLALPAIFFLPHPPDKTTPPQ